MQKKELVPTPLFDQQEKRPVEIAEAKTPSAFRLLSILGFVASAFWLWWKTSFALLLKGRSDTREGARQIRMFLERMGGLWVKAGQFIAMRRDIFRPETCDELAKLQDQARGFPFETVREVIETDLGARLEHIFSEFNPVPVAAASIGQTHEARLRENGVRVAVKVQRPFVAESFARDLKYLRTLATWFKQLGIAPQARWHEMVWELEKTLTQELDYRMEAASISRMRKKLRSHKVYAPKVFTRYCSRRMLVMEFIEGVFMSDYIKVASRNPARLEAWRAENNIDSVKVGKRLFLMHLRQLFEDNLFHCDLHPGNIVLQRNSRFALIDFGSTDSIDKSRLEVYRLLFVALAEGEYAKMADLFLLQGPPLPNQKDIVTLKADLVRVLRTWEAKSTIKGLQYHEKSLSALFNDFGKVMQKYQTSVAWDFLGMNRADLTLDASLMFLCPQVDFSKLCRTYQKQASQRAMDKYAKPGELFRSLGNLGMAVRLPSLLAENVFFEAEWIRKRAMGFEGKISKAAVFAKTALSLLAFGSVTAVGIAIGGYLRTLSGHPEALRTWWLRPVFEVLPNLRAEAWVAVALLAFYAWRKLLKIRSYVQEKEYEHPGHSR